MPGARKLKRNNPSSVDVVDNTNIAVPPSDGILGNPSGSTLPSDPSGRGQSNKRSKSETLHVLMDGIPPYILTSTGLYHTENRNKWYSSCVRLEQTAATNKIPFKRESTFEHTAYNSVSNLLIAYQIIENVDQFESMETKLLFEHMNNLLSSGDQGFQMNMKPDDMARKHVLVLKGGFTDHHLRNAAVMSYNEGTEKIILRLRDEVRTAGASEDIDHSEKNIIKILHKNLEKSATGEQFPVGSDIRKYLHSRIKVEAITSIEMFSKALFQNLAVIANNMRNMCDDLKDTMATVLKRQSSSSTSVGSSHKDQQQQHNRQSSKTHTTTTSSTKDSICNHCGGASHGDKKCWFLGSEYQGQSYPAHPNVNKSSTLKFHETSQYKDLQALTPKRSKLHMFYTVDGHRRDDKDINPAAAASIKKKATVASTSTAGASPDCPVYLPINIIISQDVVIKAKALIDTGALHSDFISQVVSEKLISSYQLVSLPCATSICPALSQSNCQRCLGTLQLNIHFPIINMSIDIIAKIIPTPFDLIIGWNTIYKYNLLALLPRLHISELVRVPPETDEGSIPIPLASRSGDDSIGTLRGATDINPNPQAPVQLLKGVVVGKEALLDVEPDSDYIHYDEDFVDMLSQPQTTDNIPTKIFGSELLQSRIRNLCMKYTHIFSRALSAQPALLPPFEIEVDANKWTTNKNRRPPRLQTDFKNKEIFRQVELMLASHIIRPSKATEWSHPLLVPKPNNEWRLTIDYRLLNDASRSRNWPIPNIPAMLRRIGNSKPKIFGKMDLTKGYFQAPMSENSSPYTAFMTMQGLYEYLRVPMGPKGAPAYFQSMLASIVLVGLIYVICELYMDDIAVHGSTDDEFLERLEAIFKRLEKHHITLNPDKCIFGASEIEFVGHTLSSEGISMSTLKKNLVVQFAKPRISRQLKQFLGLANYFRDHIRNHSMVVKPMQKLLQNYNKSSVIKWTPSADVAFEQIKDNINTCPTLFFVSDTATIFVNTDASDYGVGGYVYQVVDGQEQPIAFVSGSLQGPQLRWATNEKEAYAIYYVLVVKLAYLLKDTFFILRTDHANLTYINDAGSPKVLRWKLALSEYDFHIEHVEGEKNFVADVLSRQLHQDNSEYVASLLNSESESNAISLPTSPDEAEELLAIIDEFNIPSQYRTILGRFHNTIVGHHHVERMMSHLKAQGHSWLYMRAHVTAFIRQCPCCQKMSYLKIPIHTHPYTVASYQPMDRLAMDTIGPLPPDKFGFRYILAIICTFSRFIELYPTRTTDADEAARALIEHIGRYGEPSQITSDNGSQFVNDIITETLKLIGTEHVLTLAYSKEENAIVERSNLETMRHLRAIIFDKQVAQEWSIYRPFVQRIFNSEVNSSTGVSPAEIIFGNSIQLHRGLLTSHTLNPEYMPLSEWTAKLLKVQADIIHLAQTTQSAKDTVHIANAAAQRTEYPIGSYVLVDYHSSVINTRSGGATKLHTHRRGPLRVVHFLKDKYVLQNLVTGKTENYHVKYIYPFITDPTDRINYKDIANRDYQVHDVESILQHRGFATKKSTMTFLVKWCDLPDLNNTWEPYSRLKHEPLLHDYLWQHNLRSAILQEYKSVVRSRHEGEGKGNVP